MKGCFVLVLLAVAALIAYATLFQEKPSPSGSPPPGPAAQTPSDAGGEHAASPEALKRLIELGAQAGVQAQITGQEGKNVNVRAEWMGDSAANGGDYMELLFRETTIVRDVKDKGGRRWFDNEGRSRWTQDFVVTLR